MNTHVNTHSFCRLSYTCWQSAGSMITASVGFFCSKQCVKEMENDKERHTYSKFSSSHLASPPLCPRFIFPNILSLAVLAKGPFTQDMFLNLSALFFKLLMFQCDGSSDRPFLPYCHVHPHEKNVGLDLVLSIGC